MKASAWIDRIKTVRNWESDYRVAKELGINRATVSAYRSRTPTLDEDTAMKVAHALGVNPAIVLADQAMERAKDAEARNAWEAIIERLGGMAAACLIGVGLSSTPTPSQALARPALDSTVYYVKRRKWFSGLGHTFTQPLHC